MRPDEVAGLQLPGCTSRLAERVEAERLRVLLEARSLHSPNYQLNLSRFHH